MMKVKNSFSETAFPLRVTVRFVIANLYKTYMHKFSNRKRYLLIGLVVACASLSAAAAQWNYLYEISGAEGALGYLFGSAHVGTAGGKDALSECVDARLTASRRIGIELSPFEVALHPYMGFRENSMAEVMKDASEIDRQLLSTSLLRGRSIDEIGGAPAFRVLGQLEAMIAAKSVRKMGPASPDNLVLAYALRKGVPVVSLEPVALQYTAINSMPRDAWQRLIVNTLKILSSDEASRAMMRASFSVMDSAASGDGEALLKVRQGVLSQYGEFDKYVAYARNPALTAYIDEMLKQPGGGPVFFAMGAQHLPGEDGIANRLVKAGYTVAQICK